VDLTPVTLRGRWLTLEPITPGHAPDLFLDTEWPAVKARVEERLYGGAAPPAPTS
jgi:hypothetical protein